MNYFSLLLLLLLLLLSTSTTAQTPPCSMEPTGGFDLNHPTCINECTEGLQGNFDLTSLAPNYDIAALYFGYQS